MVEDGLFDLGSGAVGVRAAGSGQAINQAVGAVGLEVSADRLALLAAVADHLAGLGNVAEVGGEIEQAEFAACYLLFCGHVALRKGLMLLATPS